MRKPTVISAMLLAAVLFAGCTANAVPPVSPTEEPTAALPTETPTAPRAPVLWEETDISSGTAVSHAFAGEGVIDEVRIAVNENTYTTDLTFVDDGTEYPFHIDAALSFATCYYADTDTSDGFVEVFLCGDLDSDDYDTYIFRVENGELKAIEYYGTATGVDGEGHVSMDATVDVLGTYGAQCTCTLSDGFTFERTSDYTIVPDGFGDAYARYLTVIKEGLPVTDEATGASETLAVGAKLFVTGTDAATYATLLAEDGSVKRVELTPAGADDWGWYIDGVKEDEWFEQLWYAG